MAPKRYLIAALLLVAALPQGAHARAFAYLPNDGGGKIFLTDEKCEYKGRTFPGLNRSYGYASKGQSMESCWKFEEDTQMVRMVWLPDNGNAETRLYNVGDFTRMEGYEKAFPSNGKGASL